MQFKQESFDKIKRIVDRDTLSNYSNFTETFKIHTGASVF